MADGKTALPGRGRRSWSETPGGDYGEKWYQQIEHLDKPRSRDKKKEIRMAGGSYTIKQHYIKITKRDGGKTGYYELCLNFDSMTGEAIEGPDAICPVCRDFIDPDLPEELRMYPAFRHYCEAFDVDKIKSGVKDGCFGALWVNKYGRNDLVKISSTLEEGTSVDDLAKGCTLLWFYDENAKDNKDKMSFMKGEPLQVVWNEKAGKYGINYKGVWFTGTPQDFGSIIVPKSAGEIERDLKKHGYYARLEELNHASRGYHAQEDPAPRKRPAAAGRPAAAPPVEDEPFGSDAPETPPAEFTEDAPASDGWGSSSPAPAKAPAAAKAPPARTAAKPAAKADDGWGEPVTAAPTPSKAAPKAAPKNGGGKPKATVTHEPPEEDLGATPPEDDAPPVDSFGDGW